jgi:hypothetical protein
MRWPGPTSVVCSADGREHGRVAGSGTRLILDNFTDTADSRRRQKRRW